MPATRFRCTSVRLVHRDRDHQYVKLGLERPTTTFASPKATSRAIAVQEARPCALEQPLRHRVESRRRLVEHDQTGIGEEDAGESDQLRFASRETPASGTEGCVEPRRKCPQPLAEPETVEHFEQPLV